MPGFIRACEKKTTDRQYLTVEQVRDAASAWVEAQGLPPSARKKIYQETAARIAYYQRRNQQARKSHTKRTRQRLRAIGIKLDRLRSCVPDDP